MNAFSTSLRTWRRTRRLSQLDLALEAEVSARHISFLETGRARPSRDMINRLGDALALPLDATNQMMQQAGFTARFPGRDWDDAAMSPIRAAVAYSLDQHSPYPALAVDRLWNVVRMNGPARLLYAQLGINEGDSLLNLMCSADLPLLVENWPAVAHHAARRLRTESAAQGGVPELDMTADKLAQVEPPEDVITGPVLPMILNTGDLRLSLFGTIAQFGTPEDVTLDALKIELFFPADDATEQVLRAMASYGG